MAETSIEWCDRVWNCVRGCSRVSPGCGGKAGEGGCYAERMAYRFAGPGQPYDGLVQLGRQGPRWTGVVRLVPEKLVEPLRWRKPARVFVNSMSDLFHEALSNEEIAAVFGGMAACPQHTFQVLTKRPARMRRWFEWVASQTSDGWTVCHAEALARDDERETIHSKSEQAPGRPWPLPNVWLGVSVEDQQRAEERIPYLLETPAAIRWVSAEPLLAPVDLFAFLKTPLRDESLRALGAKDSVAGLDWVVVGGESGPGARPFDLGWARSIVDECSRAGVACFVKQLGSDPIDGLAGCSVWQRDKKGGDPEDWPPELRVRQWPEVPRG